MARAPRRARWAAATVVATWGAVVGACAGGAGEHADHATDTATAEVMLDSTSVADAGDDATSGDAEPAETSAADSGPLADTSAADAAGDEVEATDTPEDSAPSCPLGQACAPIVIGAFPFTDARDTGESTSFTIDRYEGCAPSTDEGGAEVFYRVDIDTLGVLSLALDDVPGDAVDVDLHLLTAPTGEACVRRDNVALRWVVRPGRWWIVVDTWVDGGGHAKPGAYTLRADLRPLSAGSCALEDVDLRMYWPACADGIDCYVGTHEGQPARYLRTPSLGPVVQEAHLVTAAESFDGNGWPDDAHDGLANHYQLSEAASGYAMDRTSVWAPFGEGGSQWGQGAAGVRPPLEAEAWYVNMYWRDRPPPGTRMLVLDPVSGRAVVAAGGYETGPGSPTAIGGAVEEIHDYLGSQHRDELLMGFLADQALPFGPIDCTASASGP